MTYVVILRFLLRAEDSEPKLHAMYTSVHTCLLPLRPQARSPTSFITSSVFYSIHPRHVSTPFIVDVECLTEPRLNADLKSGI